jgi:dsDNA-binding SOS-regulon protein
MITKQTSFSTGDRLFHTIEEAQQHELEEFLTENQVSASSATSEMLAKFLIKQKERIVDCLTMKASSKARARKANGAVRKPRTPKNTDKPAEAKLI